jgi:hypothetical protein
MNVEVTLLLLAASLLLPDGFGIDNTRYLLEICAHVTIFKWMS